MLRLERARMATLTARTGNWNIREEGGVQSPKRVRDSDWLSTPSKRRRGDRGASTSAAPTTLSLPGTGPSASPSRSKCTPPSLQLPSTGLTLTPSLVLTVQPPSTRKYKCTQAKAESPPQRPASSETGYNLENNIAQALRNLHPVVVVQSSCPNINAMASTVQMKTTDKQDRSPIQTKIQIF